MCDCVMGNNGTGMIDSSSMSSWGDNQLLNDVKFRIKQDSPKHKT